ncbi:MAG: metallophosphoesterase [Planctomycetota bacterium]
MSLPDLMPTRRAVLEMGAALLLPFPIMSWPRGPTKEPPLRLGLIADLHFGLEPTAPSRLEAFLEEATQRRADGVVQLGDFNYGDAESEPCLEMWRSFPGRRIHVLGNHDMDRVSKTEVMDRWEMAERFQSFDLGGFHFVVLDRNNLRTGDTLEPYGKANYFVEPKRRAWADPEQLEWLTADLKATGLPTVVLVHQGLGVQTRGDHHEPARLEIEKVLREANRESPKVVACFCGHHHADRYNLRDGIHYVWINSASYLWVGEKYGRMATYRDPLFAFADFHRDGKIVLTGRSSDWVSPTPKDRGYPEELGAPAITSRELRVEQ